MKYGYWIQALAEIIIAVLLIYSVSIILRVKSYTKESYFWKKIWRIDEIFDTISDELISDEKYFPWKLSYIYSLMFVSFCFPLLLLLLCSPNNFMKFYTKLIYISFNFNKSIFGFSFPDNLIRISLSEVNTTVHGYEFLLIVAPIMIAFVVYFHQEFGFHFFHFFGLECKEPGNRYSNLKINNAPTSSIDDDLNNSQIKATKSYQQKDPIKLDFMLYTSFFIASFVIYVLFFNPIFNTENINVKVDDIYYTNVTHIPIKIVETGLIMNTTMNLSKTGAEGNVSVLDSILLNPYSSDKNEVVADKYFRINTLDYGKYNAFINTINLTQGYYDLSFDEEFPVNKKITYSFYLSNKLHD
jgi:hypothetical protein